MPDWRNHELIKQHMPAAERLVAEQAIDAFSQWMFHRLGLGGMYGDEREFESPLEALFFLWWSAIVANSPSQEWLHLLWQHEVLVGATRYRLDFVLQLGRWKERELMTRYGVKEPLIAIEVDGHAFHEKTREQVAARNQRDRDLQAAGWQVFHFSHSELTTQPIECVEQVWMHANTIYHRDFLPHLLDDRAPAAKPPDLVS